MSKQTYFYVVSGVFFVVAALHLVRALSGWDLTVGDADVPLWASWVVVVITGFLSFSGFSFGRKL